eukprot:3899391-Pyramimonas_sp.AAC.1
MLGADHFGVAAADGTGGSTSEERVVSVEVFDSGAALPTAGPAGLALVTGPSFRFASSFDGETEAVAGLTAELWLRTGAVVDENDKVLRVEFAEDELSVELAFGADGELVLAATSGADASLNARADTGLLLNDGAWHHLAVTVDAATGEAAAVADGARA